MPLGYLPRTAADGPAAIAAFQPTPLTFAFALLDVSMPGMSGIELLQRLQAADPDVRAVLCSGHPRETIAPGTFASGRVEYLQKPFTTEELTRAVHRVTGRVAPQW